MHVYELTKITYLSDKTEDHSRIGLFDSVKKAAMEAEKGVSKLADISWSYLPEQNEYFGEVSIDENTVFRIVQLEIC